MENPSRSATKTNTGFWAVRYHTAELLVSVFHLHAPIFGVLFFSTATELEASRSDLGAVRTAVAKLPAGLVKRRMEAALKGVDDEIQSQLWGHLRSNSSGATGQQRVAAPAAVRRR